MWWDQHGQWRLKQIDYGTPTAIVAYRFQWNLRSDLELLQRVRQRASTVVTALRLLKPGNLGAFDYFERPTGSFQPGAHPMSTPARHRSVLHTDPGHQFEFCSDDIEAFRPLFQSLVELAIDESYTKLIAAIRRFDLSFGRVVPGDRIIDLFTALDTAFSWNERYSGPMIDRAAALLSGTFRQNSNTIHSEKFRLIQDELRTLRRVRNELVHHGLALSLEYLTADLPNHEDVNPSPILEKGATGFLYQAQDLVRQALRSFIHLQIRERKPLDEVLEDLSKLAEQHKDAIGD